MELVYGVSGTVPKNQNKFTPSLILQLKHLIFQVGIATASDTLTNANIFVSLFDDRLQWIQGGLQDFEKSSQHGFWPSDLNISFIQPLGNLAWNTFEWSSSNHWWLMIVILAMIAGLATYIYQNHYLPNYEIKDLNGVRMRKMMEFRNRQQVRAILYVYSQIFLLFLMHLKFLFLIT